MGEFSPNYITAPECRDRIYDLLGPDIKFIVALRNPIDRAFSHYFQKSRRGVIQRELHELVDGRVETLSFEKALELEEEFLEAGRYPHDLTFFEQGLYVKHLKGFFQRFRRQNFYIYLLEDFTKDPGKIVSELYRFLDVDDQFSCDELGVRLHTQEYQDLSAATRARLFRRYEPSIEELEGLLERSLAVWKGRDA